MLTLHSLRKQTQPKGAWIAQFKELHHRNEAEEILGWEIIHHGSGAGRAARRRVLC